MSGELPADPTGRQGFGNMMSMGRDLGTEREGDSDGTGTGQELGFITGFGNVTGKEINFFLNVRESMSR